MISKVMLFVGLFFLSADNFFVVLAGAVLIIGVAYRERRSDL